MIYYDETKSEPITEMGASVNVIYKQEEPCEGRLSRTVLWEGKGEIPPPGPIGGKAIKHDLE